MGPRPVLPPVLVLVAIAATAAAQQRPADPQQPPPVPRRPLTLAVGVDVVSVTAVVFDKGGRVVHGLGPGDVQLFEDGVRQEVSYFREASSLGDPKDRVPLSVVLVLDTSGSMGQSLPFLQEAVLSFVYKLDEVDRALVVSFNDAVIGSGEFTSDVDRLERLVSGLQAWGRTSLYDAVHYALDRIRDQPGRKAVIVFSDGGDNASASDEKAVLDEARAVEATVYAIGFKGQGVLGLPTGSKGFLHKVAAETGGQYFAPEKVGNLLKVFGEVSDELKNHYLLAYTPKRPPDGKWRRIDLKVDRSGSEVRVRKGYFAVPRARAAD